MQIIDGKQSLNNIFSYKLCVFLGQICRHVFHGVDINTVKLVSLAGD